MNYGTPDAKCAFLPFRPLLHFWNVINDIHSWMYEIYCSGSQWKKDKTIIIITDAFVHIHIPLMLILDSH